MKFTHLVALLTMFCFYSCQSQPTNAETVDVANFEKLIGQNKRPQLIDVRTPQEFAGGKIQNAENMNWNDAAFMKNISSLDKSIPVFVYCLSGGRSRAAAIKLAENGFVKVYDLKGGIMKWNAAHEQKQSQKGAEKNSGISTEDYASMLKTTPKTIVNIYAVWCAPCKKMQPYLLKMQAELNDDIKMVRYDADKNKNLLKTLNIDELPIILIYEGNKIVWQHAGYLSEDDLRNQIK